MKQYTIGVDVGGTKIAYGLFDENRQLVAKRRAPSDPALSAEQFFSQMAGTLRALMDEQGVSAGQMRGVGVGMPSYVRQEDGYILKTANLTNIKRFTARDYLQGLLGHEIRVVLDNDAHTAALAEHRHGAGRGFSHMLYCPVSTGISSGIIIDNKLFRGQYGWAGESGHTIVSPGDGIVCGCGNTGCMMSWCSGSMIVKHIQKWIDEGQPTVMAELAGAPENITCEHLDVAWQQGDEMALRAVDQMARYMAVWLFNLYVTLNINCYVFGGGLLGMGDKLFGPVRRYFDEYNQDSEHPVHFRTAELEEDFGIIGATELLY